MATQTVADTSLTDVTITSSKGERLPVLVTKPSPYTYDLSYLTAIDPNPLPSTSELLSQSPTTLNTTLQSIARDGAQSLITTLLTSSSTSITSTPDGVFMNLPASTIPLPRWKPLPKPKAPTKWESFARKKGIGKFGGSLKGGAALEDRRKNMVYDEEKGEWVRKWGYKGKNKAGENEWLVELDDKQLRKEKEGGMTTTEGKSIRGEGRRERMEKIRRQERRERANAKRGGRKAG